MFRSIDYSSTEGYIITRTGIETELCTAVQQCIIIIIARTTRLG